METINIHPFTSKFGKVDFHLWQDDEGWWSCRSGEWQGNISENVGDDLGPFDTKQDALEAQEADFEDFHG